jgi:DNA-binding NarL/FixJ family response regulator
MNTTASEAPPRVLLIDDDELICGSLRHYLIANGFAVDAALEPRSADLLMAANHYAAVVVDPYLTGGVSAQNDAELLLHVCAMQPQAAIIVLTAYASPSLETAATECRVKALLTKPQPVVLLERAIRAAVGELPTPRRSIASSETVNNRLQKADGTEMISAPTGPGNKYN